MFRNNSKINVKKSKKTKRNLKLNYMEEVSDKKAIQEDQEKMYQLRKTKKKPPTLLNNKKIYAINSTLHSNSIC